MRRALGWGGLILAGLLLFLAGVWIGAPEGGVEERLAALLPGVGEPSSREAQDPEQGPEAAPAREERSGSSSDRLPEAEPADGVSDDGVSDDELPGGESPSGERISDAARPTTGYPNDVPPRDVLEVGPVELPAGEKTPLAIRPVQEGTATVAVVIDDLGRSLEDVDRLQALGVPLTYAVLPFESRTGAVAAALEARGAEVLVHLPMEASTGADAGPGALTAAMGPDELRASTERALAAVPGATGVNNHMGSRLSAQPASMRAILGVLAARGYFFLDSRTSAESVGYRSAVELGLPTAERQIFLDPDPRPEAIRHQFRRLLETARQRGAAIAIGHPYPETIEVLAEEIPAAEAAGYRFVPVSYLLERSSIAAR